MKKLPPRVLADVLEQVVDRKFPYESKEKKPINWSAYNKARIDDIAGTLRCIRDYVEAVELPRLKNAHFGRPKEISAHDKAKAVLLAELFQVDERSASGLVSLFKEKLWIESEMCPRTIGRAYYDDDVQYILKKVLETTNKPIQGLATSFSADSTGQAKSNKVNWARDKEDDKKHKDFNMLSLMTSNDFHVIAAFDLNQGNKNDSPTFIPLFQETKTLHPIIDTVQLDAGFLSRQNVQYAADNGATPYFFPKRHVTLKPLGCPAWRDMIWDCVTNTQEWLRGYHPRSNSETTNSCLQRRFTKQTKRKQLKGQWTETNARIIIHNIRQLNTASYEHNIPLFVEN